MNTYDTAHAKYLRTLERREKKRQRNIQWRTDHRKTEERFAWPPGPIRSNTSEVDHDDA
jgi:hypothetical protein